MAIDMHREDVIQPTEVVEAGSEASILLSPIEPNVIPTAAEPSAIVLTTTELPSSSSTVPSADAAEGP